jgi:hypothetical protein
MRKLRGLIQWILAAAEALRWQPPDRTTFLDIERIEHGRYLVEIADRGDRRDSRVRRAKVSKLVARKSVGLQLHHDERP